MAHTAAAPYPLDYALVDKILQPGSQVRWDRLFSVDQIHNEKILSAESGQALPSDLLEEAQELRVLNFSMQRYPDRIFASPGKVGERLALLDAGLVNEIDPLSSPFHKAALVENFSNAAIARILLPEKVVFVNTRRETTRAHNLDAARILPNKNRTPESIITVANGVEYNLAHGAFIKGGHIPYEEPLLKMLFIVAEVDQLPNLIEHRQETLPKFASIRCRTRRFI